MRRLRFLMRKLGLAAGLIVASSVASWAAVADLSLTLSANNNPVAQGNPLTYTLVVTNNGPDSSGPVTLSEQLPATVSLVSATASAGSCSASLSMQCVFSAIGVNAFVTVTVVVTPLAAGSITNSAHVSETLVSDPNLVNNDASVNTQVIGPPAANSASASVTFNTDKPVTLVAVDPIALPLAYSLVANPAHGTLSGAAPNLTYRPNHNYVGPDSFTFKANNGFLDSNVATVSITVNPPTGPANTPAARDQGVAVTFNTDKPVTLVAVDPNGLPLAYSLAVIPVHGTLSGTAPNLTYRPNHNYVGPDTFTFQANNGFLNSNVATATLTVNPPTGAANTPIALDQSVSVIFNTDQPVTLVAIDPNGLPLVYSIAAIPTHGTLSGAAPNVTYTPNHDYTGDDSFTFKANNGFLDSIAATVTLTVNPPTGAANTPVAQDQSIPVTFNTDQPVTLAAIDPNGLPLAYSLVAGPTRGTLTGTAPNLTYTPNHNFAGADSFTFEADNGFLVSNVATVSLAVNAPTGAANAPVAQDQSVSVTFNTDQPVTLVAIDPNGLLLAYSLVSNPTHGTLSGTVPNLTYRPNHNYIGPDSVTFKANNGFSDSNVATVSLIVNQPAGAANAPVAQDQSVSVTFNTVQPVALGAIDPNGLPLVYSLVANPTHGSITGTAPSLTYQPNHNYVGPDTFTFKANNGFLDSNVATVSLTVSPPTGSANAPVAQDQSVTVTFNTGTPLALAATDPNGLPLTYSVTVNPAHGSVTGTAPNLTYTPNHNFVGADLFTFKANNGFLDSNAATVSLTVSPPAGSANAPTAADQSIRTPFNTAKPVTLAAADPNNLPLSYLIVTFPAHGSISGTPPDITYTPALDYQGPDSFTFKANNGFLDSNVATVSVTVDVFSPPAGTNPGTGGICGAHAYPVPYKSTMVGGITFTGLAPASRIRIFTTDARLVVELNSANGDDVPWNVRNSDGSKVASWVYLYIINQDGPCPTKEGKLVVIQ